MNRRQCLELLSRELPADTLVITPTGLTYRIWEATGRHNHLSHINLGLCIPLGIGLALALPDRLVVVMDGDGSVIFNLSGLSDLGSLAPSNLICIVFDNEGYASCEDLPSASATTTDIESVARSCGIEQSTTVENLSEMHDAISDRFSVADGPSLVVAKVEKDSKQPSSEAKRSDGKENTYRFVRDVENSEGISILKPLE